MDKSRASHEQVMKNLLTSWDQDVSKLWTSHEKVVIKSCTKSEKDLGKLKRRHKVLSDYRFNSTLGRIPYGSTPGKASTYCIYPLLHCSHLQMFPHSNTLRGASRNSSDSLQKHQGRFWGETRSIRGAFEENRQSGRSKVHFKKGPWSVR